MEKIRHQTVEVDRCTQCKGLWFDMLEQEDLRTLKGSGQIDTGDAAVGQEMNQKRVEKCPACQNRMIRLKDAQQPHIQYESCSICYGVFFDAGEFKDFTEDSVLESLKRFYEKSRL